LEAEEEMMFDVMCNVDRLVFDVPARTGHMFLPKHQRPDMRNTIRSFTAVDPEIDFIAVYEENEPLMSYEMRSDGWHVFYPVEK
jgi:hypothetical protein